jgi:putrescine transport system ATP-binding protein
VGDRAPFLRIERVTKRFGGTLAVDDVSLDIERGEFFALLGPSGCGKTTLLRMLGGFEEPDSGRILLLGADMAGVPPYRRPVNMMFQSYALFPHMTVGENVAFGLRQEGLPKREISARVAAMLDLVEMAALRDRKPQQLSGGQRQRVALARALVKEPKLLLLDDPLAALDKKLRERTQLELVGIQRRVGITFIVVTHDQEEAMTLATRLAIMDKGRLQQVGTPREVYERPASRFVAGFVGSVNLFDGRVVEAADGRAAVEIGERHRAAAGAAAVLRATAHEPVAVGTPVAIAVRPERLSLAAEPDAEPDAAATNLLHGTVQAAAYLGDSSVYHVELPWGQTVRASVANAARHPVAAFARGDEVWLCFAPDGAIVLTR